jgi:UDP-N-acetylglucosamine 4,6-dehydratase
MQDKTILVTGGCGSFGKEFVKAILELNPKQVRVYSRDEYKQASMKEELNDPRIEYFIGDVRDSERLEMAMEGVDICVHAAAMKRIEKCETDPQETIKTNVNGSVNVANACLKKNVKCAILISTDKAVYPVNLYGATKLTAEKVWIQSNTYRGLAHPTKFCVVRYGNVLGSRGSVIGMFKDQLEKGVIKVTDQRMTRFFITLQQAVDLVCIAIEMGQGGEIFIPQLKATSIYHLATLVAGQIPIEITSQRGGEKLHESLVTKEEKDRMVSEPSFSVINPEITTWPYIKWVSEWRNWTENSSTAEQYNDDELRSLLQLT